MDAVQANLEIGLMRAAAFGPSLRDEVWSDQLHPYISATDRFLLSIERYENGPENSYPWEFYWSDSHSRLAVSAAVRDACSSTTSREAYRRQAKLLLYPLKPSNRGSHMSRTLFPPTTNRKKDRLKQGPFRLSFPQSDEAADANGDRARLNLGPASAFVESQGGGGFMFCAP